MTGKWPIVISAVAAFILVAPVIFVMWINRPHPAPIEEQPAYNPAANLQANQYAALLQTGFGLSDVTVHSIEHYVSGNIPAEPGHTQFALELTLWNDSNHTYNLDPFTQFILCVNPNGTHWPKPGGLKPELSARRMHPDDKARGFLTFELPDDAEPAFLVWGYRKFAIPAVEVAAD